MWTCQDWTTGGTLGLGDERKPISLSDLSGQAAAAAAAGMVPVALSLPPPGGVGGTAAAAGGQQHSPTNSRLFYAPIPHHLNNNNNNGDDRHQQHQQQGSSPPPGMGQQQGMPPSAAPSPGAANNDPRTMEGINEGAHNHHTSSMYSPPSESVLGEQTNYCMSVVYYVSEQSVFVLWSFCENCKRKDLLLTYASANILYSIS